MTALSLTPATRSPIWLIATALGGIGWNVFGIVQFAGSVTATEASLITGGLTPDQAAVMAGYPAWMTLSFAIGVFGGLAGSVLLFFRRVVAGPVLLASLLAYVVLWISDAVHGVFAAMGAPQIMILTLVVAIAAALYGLSRLPTARVRPNALRSVLPCIQGDSSMQFMLILNETADDFSQRNHPDHAQAYWGGWNAFIGAMAQAGVIVKGDGLMGPHAATTMRLREGKRVVEDGPFADTKEQLGGYFIIEVPDLDAALDWAAQAPSARTASVEVRPVRPMPPA